MPQKTKGEAKGLCRPGVHGMEGTAPEAEEGLTQGTRLGPLAWL